MRTTRFLKAVAIARSGRLGDEAHGDELGRQRATTGGPFPTEEPPKELDWDFWLGQAPKVDFCPKRIGWDFRWWFEYSGGQVTDWGVHHTDIALWALGGEKTGVVEVEGKGEFPAGRDVNVSTYLLRQEEDADLPAATTWPARSTAISSCPTATRSTSTAGATSCLIEGEKGKIRVNRGGLTGKLVEEIEEEPRRQGSGSTTKCAKLYRGKPSRGHMANFFDCVKDRANCRSPTSTPTATRSTPATWPTSPCCWSAR